MKQLALLAIVALTAGCFDKQTVTEHTEEAAKRAEEVANKAKDAGLTQYAEALKAKAESERKNLEDKAEQTVVDSLNK